MSASLLIPALPEQLFTKVASVASTSTVLFCCVLSLTVMTAVVETPSADRP